MTTRNDRLMDSTSLRLAGAKEKLVRIVDETTHTQRAEIYGLLAATEKKEAEFIRIRLWDTSNPSRNHTIVQEIRRLEESCRKYYQLAFEADRSQIWAAVQALVMTVILNRSLTAEDKWVPADQWKFAHSISEWDLHKQDPLRIAWAHSNLIELHLLALLMPNDEAFPGPAKCRTQALEHVRGFLGVVSPDAFEILSLRRQLMRYINWWFANQSWGRIRLKVIKLAEEVFNELPPDRRFPGTKRRARVVR